MWVPCIAQGMRCGIPYVKTIWHHNIGIIWSFLTIASGNPGVNFFGIEISTNLYYTFYHQVCANQLDQMVLGGAKEFSAQRNQWVHFSWVKIVDSDDTNMTIFQWWSQCWLFHCLHWSVECCRERRPNRRPSSLKHNPAVFLHQFVPVFLRTLFHILFRSDQQYVKKIMNKAQNVAWTAAYSGEVYE